MEIRGSPPMRGSMKLWGWTIDLWYFLRNKWTIDFVYLSEIEVIPPDLRGYFREKKFFFLDKTLLSGQYNLEINFQFQKTIILGKRKVGTLLSNYHIQYTEF